MLACICGQTDILSPQQLVNICTAGEILQKRLGRKAKRRVFSSAVNPQKKVQGLGTNKRAELEAAFAMAAAASPVPVHSLLDFTQLRLP